jgi:hypothetical protein
VDVRVLGVEVGHGYPFERTAKVCFHAGHQFPGELREVCALAELGRDNELEHTRVTGGLPRARGFDEIHVIGMAVESGRWLSIHFGRAIADDIAAVSGPLAARLIRRIGYAHGTALDPVASLAFWTR